MIPRSYTITTIQELPHTLVKSEHTPSKYLFTYIQPKEVGGLTYVTEISRATLFVAAPYFYPSAPFNPSPDKVAAELFHASPSDSPSEDFSDRPISPPPSTQKPLTELSPPRHLKRV
jgi:hypothetical protein